MNILVESLFHHLCVIMKDRMKAEKLPFRFGCVDQTCLFHNLKCIIIVPTKRNHCENNQKNEIARGNSRNELLLVADTLLRVRFVLAISGFCRARRVAPRCARTFTSSRSSTSGVLSHIFRETKSDKR